MTWTVPYVRYTLAPGASHPRYAHNGDSGMDLASCEAVTVEPGETRVVRTGISMQIPHGYEGQVRPRSSLSKIRVQVQLGTIDSGYRGELGVIVHNARTQPYDVSAGARIAQLVIAPVAHAALVEVDSLDDSERGEGGFGSTGK